jgi:purine-binding chemotaxis protein CheW
MNAVLTSESKAGNPLAGGRRMAGAGRYLTFVIGGDHYGLPVQRIREIIRKLDQLTHVPQMPAYVVGCLNLRGAVVPVVDLRIKFQTKPAANDALNCIVIAEVHQGEDRLLMGLVVDAVDEVMNLKPADLEPAPEFGGGLSTQFIQSMAKVKERLVVLLDIDRVIATKTMIAMKENVDGIQPDDAINFQ